MSGRTTIEVLSGYKPGDTLLALPTIQSWRTGYGRFTIGKKYTLKEVVNTRYTDSKGVPNECQYYVRVRDDKGREVDIYHGHFEKLVEVTIGMDY